MANFQVGNDAKVVNIHLKQALKRCLANGIVINPKGTGFRQHQELWRKLEDFEYKSHDTNRYTNRGGALLLEEKERKRLNREIPRLEREVARAVQIYDEDHQQTPLLVYGKRVVNYIENQRMRFEEEKEKEKQFRALMRNKQIEEEATLGSRPITLRSARKRPVV
ncbi:hypothetical protein QYM36_018153 [Artemia franciscana]|uniref:Uncharacterized protein n=1 Tax=Artemia franciscana TaxID=6661 RepID=A0AA88KRQ2_ARTSF|nr:hypothetical protein QYM36_018153 [Artemia franciscana]